MMSSMAFRMESAVVDEVPLLVAGVIVSLLLSCCCPDFVGAVLLLLSVCVRR